MRISLTPQRCNKSVPALRRAGEILVIDNEFYDFSGLPDGATIPAGEVPCEWIVGPVERMSGELRLTLLLPHGPNPSATVSFPAPIIDPPDGVIVLPFDPPPEEPAHVEG